MDTAVYRQLKRLDAHIMNSLNLFICSLKEYPVLQKNNSIAIYNAWASITQIRCDDPMVLADILAYIDMVMSNTTLKEMEKSLEADGFF